MDTIPSTSNISCDSILFAHLFSSYLFHLICFLLFVSLEVLWRSEVFVTDSKNIVPRDYIQSSHGLRAIVTGLEHSCTTITGALLFNSPCVIDATETGYLISDSPMQINNAKPWFKWHVDKRRPMDYHLLPSDIKAMKNTTNFFDMYQVLRQRSYLFNDLNDDEHCPKPAEMIDKTPRYVYPKYFERVL